MASVPDARGRVQWSRNLEMFYGAKAAFIIEWGRGLWAERAALGNCEKRLIIYFKFVEEGWVEIT